MHLILLPKSKVDKFGQVRDKLNMNQDWTGIIKAILEKVSNRPEADDFKEPVPWQELNLLDYPEIVEKPMDLVCHIHFSKIILYVLDGYRERLFEISKTIFTNLKKNA